MLSGRVARHMGHTFSIRAWCPWHRLAAGMSLAVLWLAIHLRIPVALGVLEWPWFPLEHLGVYAQCAHDAKKEFNFPVTSLKSTNLSGHTHGKNSKNPHGTKPNVTHNPPIPKGGEQILHPCSLIPMNIIIGLLPDRQCLAANERDVGMQSSLIRRIMYTTSNSIKHPLVHYGPYLSHILTSALVPGKTG